MTRQRSGKINAPNSRERMPMILTSTVTRVLLSEGVALHSDAIYSEKKRSGAPIVPSTPFFSYSKYHKLLDYTTLLCTTHVV